ncbi:MAG: protein kinase [Planctomycetota bacterium]
MTGRRRDEPQFRERFLNEPTIAARLRHAHIVQVYEARAEGPGSPFFSMEYVEGGNLKDRLQGKGWPVMAAAKLIETLARAVSHAHRNGVIHRDLKPANVLIAVDSTPKITDFGLAKLTDGSSDHTRSGQIIGTPEYMSPEQALGQSRRIGPATDIHALGILLYELLTGQVPFRGDTPVNTLELVGRRDAVPVRKVRRDVPKDLETICLKCLEKEPGRRYDTADSLADDLRRFSNHEPVRARPTGAIGWTLRWSRRHPAVAALSLLLALAVVGGLVAMGDQWRRNANRIRALDYVATMPRLQRASGAPATARQMIELLRSQIPNDGQEDLRGFEWYYWWAHLHRGRTLSILPTANVRLAIRPDGKQLAVADGTGVRLCDPRIGAFSSFDFRAELGPVSAAAYSPDSRWLALGGDDGTVRLWNTSEQRVDRTLKLFEDVHIACVAFAPDGEMLAAASQTGLVAIGNLRSGVDPKRVSGLAGKSPSSLGFSPTGRILMAQHSQGAAAWFADSGLPVKLFGEQSSDWGPGAAAFDPAGNAVWSGLANGKLRRIGIGTGSVAELAQHMNAIHAVAVSADGNVLASAGQDQTVRLWDATSGHLRDTFIGHTDSVTELAFAPDGSWLASAGKDGRISIWPILPSPRLRTWKGPHAGGVAINRDGTLGASAGWGDGRVTIWDLSTGTSKLEWKAHGERALRVSFSSDGRFLASVGYGPAAAPNEMVKAWDVESGREVALPTGELGGIWAAEFSPDGRTLAAGGKDGRIHLCDWPDGKAWRTFPKSQGGLVMGMAFSPDCRQLAAAGSNNSVLLWDTSTMKDLFTLPLGVRFHAGHTRLVNAVAFDRGGRILASGGLDQRVILNDIAALRRLASFSEHGETVTSIAYDSLHHAFLSAGEDGKIRRWDIETKKELAPLGGHTDRGVRSIAVAARGHRAFSAGLEGSFSVWDLERMKEDDSLIARTTSAVRSMAFSPSSSALAAPCGDGTVRFWDVATRTSINTRDAHPGGTSAIAYSPHGNVMATADSDGDIKLWSLPDVQSFASLPGSKGAISGLAFSPDGRWLAAGGRNIDIWDVATLAKIKTLAGNQTATNQIAFHRDGKVLAVAGRQERGGSVRLWNVVTGKGIWTSTDADQSAEGVAVGDDFVAVAFADHAGSRSHVRILRLLTGDERGRLRSSASSFRTLALSPNGRTLATGQSDGSVRLWSAREAIELTTLLGQGAPVNSVTFAPDGRSLASASHDGAIRLWRAAADGAGTK